jgi:hypothetical protein
MLLLQGGYRRCVMLSIGLLSSLLVRIACACICDGSRGDVLLLLVTLFADERRAC